MDGGRQPIRDGDYLLLEWVTDTSAGSITGTTMAIERQDTAGDDQYLLRVVRKTEDGRYILRANNPEYPDLEADDAMRTFARLRAVLDPLAVAVGQSFQRQEIPQLFGVEYSAGAWQSGHVVLPDSRTHILLVTLNKQGKGADYRYLDYFIDERTFHWQSQNQTTPESKRGRELIEHRQRGIDVHLFVRDHKLGPDGRAAPFRYTLREPMMTTSDDMTPFGYLEAQQDRDPLAHLEVVDPIRSGIPVATAEEMLHAVGLSLKELADLSGRGAACALADRRRGVEPVAQSPASGRV